MWRTLAKRALLRRGAAAPELRVAPLYLQVTHHEIITLPLPSIESASCFSLFSGTSHFQRNPRFFSSNSAENFDDPFSEPRISEGKETFGGFDSNATNAFGGDATFEPENEDSIFNDSVDNLGSDRDLGENFDGSVASNENWDSVAMEDESTQVVKKNDPEKVEDLLSLLQSSGTGSQSLEHNFEGMDLVLDDEFVLKVLETPYIPGENLIGFFSWVLKKPEFKATTPMLDLLVSAVCRGNGKREAYALWDLVKELGEKEKGLLSTSSLNELIAEFSKLGKGKAAFDAFNKFEEEFGCLPNADTYYVTIEALCKRSFYDWACSVCEKMLNADQLPDVERVGKIIYYLCKGGRTKDAHLVYLYAKDKNINPSRSTIDFLILSLCRLDKAAKGTVKEINKELDKETVSLALGLLSDYSAEDRKYAIKPFSSVIKKLCWIEDIDRAKKLLLEMIQSGPTPGNAAFNYVINGLSKAGDMEAALNIMKLMESRGLKPDVYTYNVLMSGYARGGEMDEASKIFDEAKKKHSKLSPITFHTLIRGFCKLEQFDKALNTLGEMKQYGVQANHDEYNKLIKSLCFKALDWETAEKLEEEMRANGVILNGRTRALISAVKELQQGVSTEASSPP